MADDAVILSGRTLADISAGSIVTGNGGRASPPPAPVPSAGVSGAIAGNLDAVHVSHLLGAEILDATPTRFVLSGPMASLTLAGTGFTYDADEQLTGGTATTIDFLDRNASGQTQGHISGIALPVATLAAWVFADANVQAFSTLFSGSDSIGGSSAAADLLRGYDGDDVLNGFGGSDVIYGGAGDDTIAAGVSQGGVGADHGPTYLRGDEGNDSIVGGAGFDDINGNMGNDTCVSGGGDDWVVGGKDNDSLVGSAGQNLVYGNLGADTCDGGDGNDIVRGGQENDIVRGGAGDDFVSGDKGDDTVTGGAGADLFHTFGDAGLDRVTDFSVSEGDRVQLDPGTQFTVSQVGADTVINMTGGGQMVLVGVAMSTLTPGWIFGA
jgi:Ca2+-binding RTX toxin-like protein